METNIFGSLPIACPKCNTVMELKACITDPTAIAKACPNSARAPPQLTFNQVPPNDDAQGYLCAI